MFIARLLVPALCLGALGLRIHAQEPAPQSEKSADAAVEQPALNGNCPTGYLGTGGPVKGKPEIQWRYANQLYYFSSEQALEDFKADPEKYLPQFGGWCAMALGGPYGNRLPGDPEVAMLLDGKVYLFSSVRARNAYLEKPEGVLDKAYNLFEVPVALGYCPVSFLDENKAVRGFRQHRVVVDRLIYQCASREAHDKFAAHPEKYAIAYKGLCANSLANGQRYNADPEHFQVIEGRTFLLLNDEAKKEFIANAPDAVKRADEQWKRMIVTPKK